MLSHQRCTLVEQVAVLAVHRTRGACQPISIIIVLLHHLRTLLFEGRLSKLVIGIVSSVGVSVALSQEKLVVGAVGHRDSGSA